MTKKNIRIKKFPILESGLVVVLALVFGGLVFGTVAVGKMVLDLRTKTATAQSEVAELTKAREDFLSLKRSIEKIESEEAKVSSLVPTRNSVLNNIRLLEQMASATQNSQTIDIFDLPPDPKKKAKKPAVDPSVVKISLPSGYDSVDYNIALKGSFSGLMAYLDLLEHQPFLTSIKAIDIQAEKTDKRGSAAVNSGAILTKIEGRFFFEKE